MSRQHRQLHVCEEGDLRDRPFDQLACAKAGSLDLAEVAYSIKARRRANEQHLVRAVYA